MCFENRNYYLCIFINFRILKKRKSYLLNEKCEDKKILKIMSEKTDRMH